MTSLAKTILLAVVANQMVTEAAAGADRCRALALSGGGSNGAWEAGVIWGLMHYGDPADFDWDVVTGISAGSINTLALAGWDLGTGKEMSEWLSDLWQNLKTDEVWKHWKIGLPQGVLFEGGAVNNTPLLEYLQDRIAEFPEGYKRRVTLSSVNANTGENVIFDQTNTEFTDLPKAAVSSASIAFVFPAFVWPEKDGVFLDGSTAWNVNIESAVHQCMQIVDDESKITIDILLAGNTKEVETKDQTNKVIGNYLRNRAIHKHYHSQNEVAMSKNAFPKVDFRYTFEQQNSLFGLKEIHFDNKTTWSIQADGREQAKQAIKDGPNTGFMDLKDYVDSHDSPTWSSYVSSIFQN